MSSTSITKDCIGDAVHIKYDNVESCMNSWRVKINQQTHFFPFSLCSLDEKSKEIICPMWMAIDKGIEAYAVV